MVGVIQKALSGFYYVDCEGKRITCRGRGKLRHDKLAPLVGDRVEIALQPDGTGIVERIIPRKNQFRRPAVANIDTLVIVASGAIPVTDPFLIDRMTALAESKSCEVFICFNKWDLEQPHALYEVYAAAGFPTFRVSTETGEGIELLREQLTGKICAFAGDSGVGKSSILNSLAPELSAQVGEVSEKLGRGRHTTRHVELFRLENGALIADTPGFASLEETEELTSEELPQDFREFRPYLNECRFVGCSHVKESGCAVLEAVLTGNIAESRHGSYVKLLERTSQIPSWKRKKMDNFSVEQAKSKGKNQ